MDKTYTIMNSEKCYRFKPDAFCSHAPENRGIYELVTFNEKQEQQVLFVGAAFSKGIRASLEGHADGTISPDGRALIEKHGNLYFDYLIRLDAKSQEDAQDIYWWLVQKHKPLYNNIADISHSNRYNTINVVEQE
jgi:hypothetical protein